MAGNPGLLHVIVGALFAFHLPFGQAIAVSVENDGRRRGGAREAVWLHEDVPPVRIGLKYALADQILLQGPITLLDKARVLISAEI